MGNLCTHEKENQPELDLKKDNDNSEPKDDMGDYVGSFGPKKAKEPFPR